MRRWDDPVYTPSIATDRTELTMTALEKSITELLKEAIRSYPSDWLIEELQHRRQVLLFGHCPFCERDYDLPSELLLLKIKGEVK